jgi:hypothetical protein
MATEYSPHNSWIRKEIQHNNKNENLTSKLKFQPK